MEPNTEKPTTDFDGLNDINAARTAAGGVHRVTIHRRVKSGEFPPPDATISGRNYWLTSTLRRYIAEQVGAAA